MHHETRWHRRFRPCRHSESIWNNHRFKIYTDYHVRAFFTDIVETTKLQDLLNERTNRLFQRAHWMNFIRDMHLQKRKRPIDQRTQMRRADQIIRVIKQIPRHIRRALRAPPPVFPEKGEIIATLVGEQEAVYWRWLGNSRATKLWVDAVGIPHDMGIRRRIISQKYAVTTWEKTKTDWHGEEEEGGDKIITVYSPTNCAFPAAQRWSLGTWTGHLSELTIKVMTREVTMRKFQENPAPVAWRIRIPSARNVDFPRVWKLRSYYTTPRDKIPWLKMINRNLYLQRDDPCPACGQGRERILHLARCPVVSRHLWEPLIEFMKQCDIKTGERCDMFFIFGYIEPHKYACPDAWGIVLLAWRCLYAEVVSADEEGKRCNLKAALLRVLTMMRTRLKAYGKKWKRWSSGNRLTSRKCIIPLKHRKKKLFECDADGIYSLHSKIDETIERIQP